MEVLLLDCPSRGQGSSRRSSITIRPFPFLKLTEYLENVPTHPLDKCLYDIKWLEADDPNILDCELVDLDYFIFLKKSITIAKDINYTTTFYCPNRNHLNHLPIKLSQISFNKLDYKKIGVGTVKLNGRWRAIGPPTIREFLSVLNLYIRVQKVKDLDMVKLLSLFREFQMDPNTLERDILEAEGDDVTLLTLLSELYFSVVQPVKTTCLSCNKETGERRDLAIGINSLIANFFREVIDNNPITTDKILFE